MKSTAFSKPWYNPGMKEKTILLILSLLLLLAFVSCKTAEIVLEPVEEIEIQPQAEPEEQPEEVVIPEEEPREEVPQVIPEETEPQTVPEWQTGEIGPHGKPVFECEGRYLEISEPLYEVQSYESAEEYCKELSSEELSYRLPTVAELAGILQQLVEKELVELDFTYYWSSEENEDGTVKILNFDTGFEGSFYKDMDFVSAIAVTEL